MANVTNYGWAYVHPTASQAQARGVDKSIQFLTGAVDSNGIGVGSGSANLTFDYANNQLALTGNMTASGHVSASAFYGDGSNLTGISGVSVANQADNKLITTTGTTDALNAETNLSYNGTKLTLTGSSASPVVEFINTSGTSNEGDVLKLRASGRGGGVDDTDIFLITNDSDTRTFGVSNAGTVNTTGNIIMTSGKGIDFSAQTVGGIAGVSVTSEILVHYEEGTFTPFISASSSAPSVSYGAERGGKYTRIGDVVFYSLGMNLASYSGGSGNVYIGGFPYIGSGNPGWDGAHVFRDCSAIGLNSRTNTLGAWMESSAVAGYPILYFQTMSSTSNFGAGYIAPSSISTGRITVHGHYKVG